MTPSESQGEARWWVLPIDGFHSFRIGNQPSGDWVEVVPRAERDIAKRGLKNAEFCASANIEAAEARATQLEAHIENVAQELERRAAIEGDSIEIAAERLCYREAVQLLRDKPSPPEGEKDG
jgi:hypothetical protein